MHKPILTILLSVITTQLLAQSWDIQVGGGLNSTRIIPVNHSTHHTPNIRYGFFGPGIYLSPELFININEHSNFSFGYQLSENTSGLKFRAPGGMGDSEYEYETFTQHYFSVGYYYSRFAFHDRAQIGWFAKAGLAYGYNTGSGGGSASNASGNNQSTTYVSIEKLSGYEVMPDFWIPCTALGFVIGPRSKKPILADRLTLSMSVTMGWKNIYQDYAKIHYTIISAQSSEEGIAQYEGMPMEMQVGINYRLFHFSKSNY